MESPYKGKTGLRRVCNALGYSLAGLAAAYRNEDAFRQEVLLAVILVPLAFYLGEGAIARALMIGSVWAAIGGVGFTAVAKSYRSSVERAQLALEQALDRLEHPEPPKPGSLFDVLASVINR